MDVRRRLAQLAAAVALVCGVLGTVQPAAGGGRVPRLRIEYPTRDGRTLDQNAVFKGWASDDGLVVTVRVSIDGGHRAVADCRCRRDSVRWRYVLPELSFGEHDIEVIATDDTGKERVAGRTILITEPTAAYRAFTAVSWWNTPFPANAPADPHSRRWIRTINRVTEGTPLRLTGLPHNAPEQAQPFYFSTADDPRRTIDPGVGPTVTIRIPRWAIPSDADSPKMTVIDPTTDQGIGLTGARFLDGTWTATGLDRYWLSSDGIAEDAGGTAGNRGHRGATMVLKALRLEEVLLPPIQHRAQCFVPPTLIGARHVWPMTGSDGERPGGIPEGIVLRIRPRVGLSALGLSRDALVIATMLQDYGCLISDGGAPGAVTLRLSRADWRPTRLTGEPFSALGWRDWQFVDGGYRP